MAKGRPPMTPEQKAAAKEAREAAKVDAKANAGAKADKAEARAGKFSAGTAKPQSTANTDDLDREEKALFLNHLPLIKKARERVGTATADLRNLYKKAKAEGNFTKADFDTAIAVETAENEARERAAIARKLRIAQIMGSSLGAQLDMFLEPDRTPAADNAFAEGESDAMQNKPARPKYDPSTEQARKYLEGFHSVSEKRIKEGIGKLDPEAAKVAEQETKGKVETDLQRAQDAKAFDKPNGGAGEAAGASAPSNPAMTRSQFKAQEEARKAAGKPN